MIVSEKEVAPQVLVTPRGPDQEESLLIEASLARSAQEESPELVVCFRHEGKECPRCDGSGFRPRKHCVGCGEPSGRPSQGGKALRRYEGAWYCLHCDPRFESVDLHYSCLERMGG